MILRVSVNKHGAADLRTTRHVIPAIYPISQFAEAGGLMSYGTNYVDTFRQVGVYVGRMNRREFISLLGIAAAWPKFYQTLAKQSARSDSRPNRFTRDEDDWCRVGLAAELVQNQVKVIATSGGLPSALAAKAVKQHPPVHHRKQDHSQQTFGRDAGTPARRRMSRHTDRQPGHQAASPR